MRIAYVEDCANPESNALAVSDERAVLLLKLLGHQVALVLLIVGGLNWALVGLFNFDLVAMLFGDMTMVTRIVCVLVGIAALCALTLFPRVTRPA